MSLLTGNTIKRIYIDEAMEMKYRNNKKYICIGGTRKKFKSKKIHPKEVARLYGVNPEECIFFKDENRFKNDNHRRRLLRTLTVGEHFYILRPRRLGDYKEHLAYLKTTRLLEGK